MSRVRSKDTTPELIVRTIVHRMGFRYRLHSKTLPESSDLVFAGRRKIVFVHGCFWPGHNCRAGRNKPESPRFHWNAKLERNRKRDGGRLTVMGRLERNEPWWRGLTLTTRSDGEKT